VSNLEGKYLKPDIKTMEQIVNIVVLRIYDPDARVQTQAWDIFIFLHMVC